MPIRTNDRMMHHGCTVPSTSIVSDRTDGWEQKGNLRQIDPGGEALHDRIAQTLTIYLHRQRIAVSGRVGEDVTLNVTPAGHLCDLQQENVWFRIHAGIPTCSDVTSRVWR